MVQFQQYLDQILRYTTRLPLPRIQLFKTFLISSLLLILVIQLFHTSSSSSKDSSHSGLLVIKPEDAYNSHYDSLIDLTNLEHLSLNEKCNEFFKQLSSSQEFKDFDWFKSNLNGISIVPRMKTFVEGKKQEAKEAKKHVTGDMIKSWEKEFNENYSNDKIYIKKLIDFISNLRIYGTCYIEDNLFKEITGVKKAYNLFWEDEAKKELDNTNTFQLSNELEIRMFPWLTRIYPVFKHGLQQLNVGLPEIATDNDDQDYNSKSSFLYNYKHGLNGKGIVIPIMNRAAVNHVLRLAKVLRFIGNKYPIQFVHHGVISEDDESKIYEAYTKDIELDDVFNEHTIAFLGKEYDLALPKQDVYFVNMKMSISESYRESLNPSTFKNLAVLFSSFQKIIMMDPFIVPFNKILELFENEKFQSTGSYFFPNYRLKIPAKYNDLEFFTDLMPNKIDEHFFGIQQVSTSFLEQNRFFSEKFSNVINNDILAIDKRDNFLGILLALTLNHLPLNFETPLIENEFIWLGILMGGEPDVFFHNIPPATLGYFTDEPNRRIHLSASKEICSTHKGYFDSTDSKNATLLFMTDGALNCEKTIDFEKDIHKAQYRGFRGRINELKKWTNERSKIRAAIFPVKQEYEAPNNIDEEDVSISNHEGYCAGTMYCSYDILGAKDDKKYHGDVLEFDEHQYQLIEFVERLWA